MASYGGWELSDFPENDTDEWKRRLVDVEKEQHTLQAKSDFEKPHLTRTVCALANSRGGVLLLGVATEDGNDAITGIPGQAKEITDQWVENVIKTGVEPCPNLADYRVHGTAGESEGRTAYAVFVPESAGGPHQDIRTGVYWNLGIQGCKRMTDREIRDAMGRGQKPEFDIRQSTIPYREQGREVGLIVRMELVNNGRGTARDVIVLLRIPEPLSANSRPSKIGFPNFVGGVGYQTRGRLFEWSVGVMPPDLARCGSFIIRTPSEPPDCGTGNWVYEVYADGIEPRHFCAHTQLDGTVVVSHNIVSVRSGECQAEWVWDDV
jgi:hypothetical protein